MLEALELFEAENSDDEDAGEGGAAEQDEEEDEEEEQEDAEYELPDGWEEKAMPEQGLTRDLVGSFIMFKWDGWGWSLGKVVGHINPTTKLGRKYNFKVSYASDTQKTPRVHKLDLDQYGDTTEEAQAGSWVLVAPA